LKIEKDTKHEKGVTMQTRNQPDYFWKTDRVCLRPLRIDDAEKKWKEWFDTETRRFLEFQLDLPPVSLQEYTRQLEDICEFKDTSRFTSFAIDNLDSELVGWINLFAGDTRNGNFSFGISVFREYQRLGYAENAIDLILRYGFYDLRLHRCNSECLAVNQPSIQLHKKLGFQEEGRRRKMIYMNGGYHDVLLFGMLIDEYQDRANHL
jgi:RimJ/RimL family protein N-acetyltransferase